MADDLKDLADTLQRAKAGRVHATTDALRRRGFRRWVLLKFRDLFGWIERNVRDELNRRTADDR